MKALVPLNKIIVLDVLLNGNDMSEENKKNNIFKKIQKLILTNLKYILPVLGVIIVFYISFQTYYYFRIQDLKKDSINFFKSIDGNEEALKNLINNKDNKNIFSTLSILKIIQNNNELKNYNKSNDLYKELIFSSNLDNLYKSSIAVHASFTLINASYIENTNNYIKDIKSYIDSINADLENYQSFKKELEYLLLVTEIDLNKSNYKNNKEVLKLYNDINNSNLISSSIKERVKKIHEFHLYN